MTAIDDFLRREIDVGSFPSASYAIGTYDQLQQAGAVGNAVAVPLRIPATIDTIYDCASVTKALITTTLVLRLGLLEQFIHGYPVRRLLTHTSGLRAWMPTYAYADPVAAILEHGPEYEPGTRVVYSDLNFILLWELLGRERYVDLVHEHISADALFNPPASLLPRIAATEWGQRFEPVLASRFDIQGLRQGLMWGETNDGNSFHLGGTAGNAGLFATATTAFSIAQRIARGEFYDIDAATQNHTAGLGEPRGLGWQLASPDSPATAALSPRAYGHMGFTGTSVWIDPEAQKVMVLLTNRIHPCAAPIAMNRIRGEFHRLALTR